MALEPLFALIGGALKLGGEGVAWVREAFGGRKGPERAARWARDAQATAERAADTARPLQDRLAACDRALDLCRRIIRHYPETPEARELLAHHRVLRIDIPALEALRQELRHASEAARQVEATQVRERTAVAELRTKAKACAQSPTADCVLTVAEAALAELQTQAARAEADARASIEGQIGEARRAIVAAMSERMDEALVRAKSDSFGGMAGNAGTIVAASNSERAGDVIGAIALAAELFGDDRNNLLFGIARRQAAHGRTDDALLALQAVPGSPLLVDWHARELAEGCGTPRRSRDGDAVCRSGSGRGGGRPRSGCNRAFGGRCRQELGEGEGGRDHDAIC